MSHTNNLRTFSRLNLASIITNFGSGLTWTGLPYLAVIATDDNRAFGLLFLIQGTVALLANLVAGNWSDRYGPRIVILAGSTSGFFVSVFAAFAYGRILQPIICITILGVTNAIILNFTTPALQHWVGSVVKSFDTELEISYAQRNIQIMIAKLAGFGFGPLVFGYLQQNALYLDALTFMAEFLIIFLLAKPESNNFINKLNSVYSSLNIIADKKNTILFSLSILAGMNIYPMIVITLNRIYELQNNGVNISAFWVFATICSIFSNWLVPKVIEKNIPRKTLQLSAAIISLIAILNIYISYNSITLLIINFGFLTLCNPIFMNIHRSNLVRVNAEDKLGRTMGLNEFCYNLGSVFALTLLAMLSNTYIVLFILFTVMLLRIPIVNTFYTYMEKESLNQIHL